MLLIIIALVLLACAHFLPTTPPFNAIVMGVAVIAVVCAVVGLILIATGGPSLVPVFSDVDCAVPQ